jgi:hypothetical protein
MVATHHWCRVTLIGPDGDRLASWDMSATRAADLTSVDEVARIALWAQRLGSRVVLTDVSEGLRELLGLAGLPFDLRDALAGGSAVEVQGQPELGEEPFGLQEHQEEAHPGDLPP